MISSKELLTIVPGVPSNETPQFEVVSKPVPVIVTRVPGKSEVSRWKEDSRFKFK